MGKNTKLIIGIQGIVQGVGTTHIAFAFATYFYKWIGMNTCYIEYGNREGLASYIKDKKIPYEDEQKGILYKDTICYCSPSKEDYINIINKGYQCVVIDFPYDLGLEHSYEFLRCDRKFIVCTFKDWNYTTAYKYFSKYMDFDRRKIKIILNLSNVKEKKNFYKLCGYKGVIYPYQEDPFIISEQSIKILGDIFIK